MGNANAPFDPEQLIRHLGELGTRVRFGQGVVGKTGRAMIGIIALWAGIILKLGTSVALDIALLIAGIVVTAVFVWWTRATQDYAKQNPAQAMMEGTELLEWQKFEATIKGGADPATAAHQLEIKKVGSLK